MFLVVLIRYKKGKEDRQRRKAQLQKQWEENQVESKNFVKPKWNWTDSPGKGDK